MLLSIIIPVYNIEKYIDECLSSLVEQCDDNIEIIVIDDGCTDNSYKYISNYTKLKNTKIRYYRKNNGGLSSARNYGLQYAEGEYVWFFDGDDYIEKNAMSDIVEKLKGNMDLLVINYFEAYDDVKDNMDFGQSRFLTNEEYIVMPPCAWNKIIKRDILIKNEILFPEGIWYEDLATTGRYVLYTKEIYYFSRPIYGYRQRANSIMNQPQYNPKMMDIMASIININKYLSDSPYIEALEYISALNLLYTFPLRFSGFKKYENIKKCTNLYRELYTNPKGNKYIKNKSLFFRLVVSLSYNNMFMALRPLNKIKQLKDRSKLKN